MFLLMLSIAGCDLGSGNGIEDRIRADAMSRSATDCGAAASCRVSIVNKDAEWDVTVSPTALGISGDPQFNSGTVHHYRYDSSGTFVEETADF
ncbi:MAG: hypothetical protein ACREPT_08375 [Rudaea sp.]